MQLESYWGSLVSSGGFYGIIRRMKPLKQIRAAAFAAILLSFLTVSCLSIGGSSDPSPTPEPTPAPDDIYSLVSKGDMEGLRAMLKAREMVNSPNAKGDFPLHVAVQNRDAGIAEFLLAMGARVDPTDAAGRTPLKLAADLGAEPLVKLLAGKGANIFALDAEKMSPVDVVLRGRSPGLLAALLSRENVNSTDASGGTILHRAAETGLLDLARAALELGPELNKKDAEGKTPLDEALLRPQSVDCARVAELLVQRGGTTFITDFAWFLRSARDGDYNSRRFTDGNAPIHEAVLRNQRGYVQFLVEKRVELNAKNTAGQAPLHEAVRLGSADMLRLLLSSGADPNVRDSFDNTPLMITMPRERRAEIVSLLLSKGASAEVKDRNGNGPLHIAAILSWPSAESVLLLEAGARVDPANADGNTPLMFAVQKRNADLISLFLSWKANMFALNGKKDSPLTTAFRLGKDVAAMLINKDTVNIRDDTGMTPLMMAVQGQDSIDVVKAILEAGADVAARSNAGDTALHLAVRRSRRDMGELLLAAQADVFAANMAGELPLTAALGAADGSGDWILSPSTIAARDRSGDGVLHYVSRMGLARTIPAILAGGADIDARNGAGETPLHTAVKADAADAVKALLALKANSGIRDGLGNTALHLAVQWNAARSIGLLAGDASALRARNLSGKTAFHEACRRDSQAFASLLLAKGADPNARDGTGASALMEAVDSKRLDMARWLLESARADPLLRDDTGSTALHLAVRARNAKACALLLAAGADIHARNAAGETPFLASLQHGREGLQLVIGLQTVNRQDGDGRSPLHIAILSKPVAGVITDLLSQGASVDARDKDGETVLFPALRAKQHEAVRILVQSGADIWARNALAQSPVQMALSMELDQLKALVAGTTVNGTDYLGNTLLHAAAQAGKSEAAAWLLSEGADPAVKNYAGETPADLAAKRGFTKLAAELRPR